MRRSLALGALLAAALVAGSPGTAHAAPQDFDGQSWGRDGGTITIFLAAAAAGSNVFLGSVETNHGTIRFAVPAA